jgi:hypothetical protein
VRREAPGQTFFYCDTLMIILQITHGQPNCYGLDMVHPAKVYVWKLGPPGGGTEVAEQ